MTLPTDIDFELDMSVIDQAHAEHTRRRRSSKKEGREEFNKPGYRSAQLDYIQYCALQGGSGCFFRGVQVPDEKNLGSTHMSLQSVLPVTQKQS